MPRAQSFDAVAVVGSESLVVTVVGLLHNSPLNHPAREASPSRHARSRRRKVSIVRS
jgi:hypothetical protein